MPTPIENQIPASAGPIAVELTTGEKVSSERAVRWYDPDKKEWIYQVELDGKQYEGRMLEDGKVALL
jgi:hypothetical protein